jgi:hypothetical protein
VGGQLTKIVGTAVLVFGAAVLIHRAILDSVAATPPAPMHETGM